MSTEALLETKISNVDKPILEVDLDDCILRDVNLKASAFVVRITRNGYVLDEIANQGRIEPVENRRLYDLRQRFFDSSWHLARMQPEKGSAKAFAEAAEMVTIDILTGRREHLRPTLLALLDRHELSRHIQGEIQMRAPEDSYGSYKLNRAKARMAQGAVEDDYRAIEAFSHSDIFTIGIEQPWNRDLQEGPNVKKAKSFNDFVAELSTYPSWEAMVKDHRNKIEIERLARTYHPIAWFSHSD